MMPQWYKAICLKEIYWPEKDGDTYRQGDSIKIVEADIRILTDAGVIGDVKKITTAIEIENATKKAPENAMRQFRNKRG